MLIPFDERFPETEALVLGSTSHDLNEPPRVHIDSDDRSAKLWLNPVSLKVELLDGCMVTVPPAWYPRLLHAAPGQRTNWEIAGGGYGIHWPDIDEDLSSEGLLRGAPAPRQSVRS